MQVRKDEKIMMRSREGNKWRTREKCRKHACRWHVKMKMSETAREGGRGVADDEQEDGTEGNGEEGSVSGRYGGSEY